MTAERLETIRRQMEAWRAMINGDGPIDGDALDFDDKYVDYVEMLLNELEAERDQFWECAEPSAVCMDEEGRIHYSSGAWLYLGDGDPGDVPHRVFHNTLSTRRIGTND